MKGFPSSQKILGKVKAHQDAKVTQEYVTLSPSGFGKHAMDVTLRAFYPLSLVGTAIDVVQPTEDADRVINVTGHGAREGDIIRFSSGSLIGLDAAIIEIADANTLVLGLKLPSAPVAGVDEIQILRGTALKADAAGTISITSGPLAYVLDGASQDLTEDTVTPANNRFAPFGMSIELDGVQTRVVRDTVTPANTVPVPIEIVSTSGTPATFNITTGDIGVHTTHDGNAAAIYDSMRIGDGTNLAGVNASLELLVKDTSNETLLTSLDGKDFATQTTLALLEGKDFATQTTLAALAAEDFATQTTLALLEGKDFATQTTLAALAAEDFATQTTLALLEGKDFATQTTLALLEGKDFSTEVTLAAMSAKLPAALGQLLSAASMSVVLASDQSNLPVVSKGKTAADFVRNDHTVTSVTTGAWVQLSASLPNACTALDIFDSSGQTLEIGIGAAAAESAIFRVFPGGNGHIPVALAAGVRVSVRAVSANASVGELNINFYQ